jgi:glycerol-3-phosphate dehydrogenase
MPDAKNAREGCGGGFWYPDLRKDEQRIDIDVMAKL